MLKYRSQILLALILLLALGLRVWGIHWGLPNSLHRFSYHTDESVMLINSSTIINYQGINVLGGQILPHFYNYGTLQLYLINLTSAVAEVYSTPPANGNMVASGIYTIYLTGRLLSAVMGTITVGVLWAFGRRVYSDTAGLLGALLLAITPLHAQHSHFMTVDVPGTLWVTLALLWSARALQDENPLRAFAVAGTMAGFAAATKYNCALAILPIVAAAVVRTDPGGMNNSFSKVARLPVAIIAALVAYLIGCPGTLLEPPLFVHDFLFEARHVSSQQELWFQGTGLGYWYVIVRNLDAGLGLPLLLAALAGAVYAAKKRTPGDWMLLVFAVPYYLVVGAAESRYARYEIPLLPVLALWAGRLLIDGATTLHKPIVVWPARIAFGVVFAVTALSTILLLRPLSQEDPRDRAEQWIVANVPRAAQIGMPVEPWFWSPPVDPYFCAPGPGTWETLLGGPAAKHRIVVNKTVDFDTATLESAYPPIVTMSEYEYYDRLRLHFSSTEQYIQDLRVHYYPPMVFKDVHPLGGKTTISGLPCQDLPHDMLYPSPTILVFRRR
jgi:hypothetical protein